MLNIKLIMYNVVLTYILMLYEFNENVIVELNR